MLTSLLTKIAKALDQASIPYMVIGDQAVLLYGEPRLTEDVDITIGLSPDDFAQIETVAANQGWNVLTENAEAFVRDTYVLPCAESESGTRIDFVFSVTPYERSVRKWLPEFEDSTGRPLQREFNEMVSD